MTTKTIECIDCGASVPYGRLSCPACGALLASVSGGRSTVTPAADVAVEVASDLEPEPLLLPDEDPPSAWPPLEEPQPVLAGRPYRRFLADDPLDAAPGQAPSAYRPSGLTLSGAAAGSGWAGPAVTASVAVDQEPATTTVQSRLGPLDPTRLAEIAGWFVVVGATMAVLGFLLPWSRVVIGARSAGSYFDTWGLASSTHVIVLAATMVVLALGIVRTAVPAWVRAGVLPLALGSLLIGLAWPYQIGPLGADVGALVVALGGLALVIGGVVSTWATRHVEVDLVV